MPFENELPLRQTSNTGVPAWYLLTYQASIHISPEADESQVREVQLNAAAIIQRQLHIQQQPVVTISRLTDGTKLEITVFLDYQTLMFEEATIRVAIHEMHASDGPLNKLMAPYHQNVRQVLFLSASKTSDPTAKKA